MLYPTIEIDDRFYRLIPSRFPPVELYSRLGSSEIQAEAKALEDITNPRLRAQKLLADGAEAMVSENRFQNWNLAPFAYPNPDGTTFLGPAYRVLEVVSGIRAALAVAVLRRENFLSSTAEPPISVEMRQIIHPVKGKFVDLTSVPLEPDPRTRWKLGEELYESGAQGIVFHRPELPDVRAIAIFDGDTLGRAIQSDHYRIVWDGKAVIQIGSFNDGEVIQRDKLFDEFRRQVAA